MSNKPSAVVVTKPLVNGFGTRFSKYKPNAKLLIGYLLLAIYFTSNYVRFGSPWMDWSKYVRFSEILPYQARCLMALVYSMGERILGDSYFVSKLGNWLPGVINDPRHAIILVVVSSISFILCCLLADFLGNCLFQSKWPSSPFVSERIAASSCVVCMLFALFVLNINHNLILPYDLPGVAFQFLLLAMVLTRAPIWIFLVTFVLATLNRETTLFVSLYLVVLVFLLTRNRCASVYYVKAMAGSIVAWLAVRITLAKLFSAAPSDEGSRLLENLGNLIRGYHLPSVVPIIILCLILCISCDFRRCGDQQACLVEAFPFAGLLGFALLFNYAMIVEMRAFGDLIPYFFVSCCKPILRPSGHEKHDHAIKLS